MQLQPRCSSPARPPSQSPKSPRPAGGSKPLSASPGPPAPRQIQRQARVRQLAVEGVQELSSPCRIPIRRYRARSDTKPGPGRLRPPPRRATRHHSEGTTPFPAPATVLLAPSLPERESWRSSEPLSECHSSTVPCTSTVRASVTTLKYSEHVVGRHRFTPNSNVSLDGQN